MILLLQQPLDKPGPRNNDIRHQLRKEPDNPARVVHATFRAALVATCEPQPTAVEDIDFEKLEGMQSECAKRAASAAVESFSDDTAWTDLLSVESAAEAVSAVTDASHLELQSCITDIYLMGIEDGRVLEREVY